ncbi:hypothetical protein [Pediococcus acidilactici]|uniref:hypothetical protein n=1 Tax=Pediococcus acidilactici TaxID=1254 RepID=UPI00232DBCEE|nr:hypothetical protein [Pediococcus acidilactici]MDB8858800.1 hypothetical protein [Pediococcus acidilactici]MDB8861090.1 hypothetical protein [Pediococcus acidilactici]MDB8862018.1 hypothetical protein [Pediococcus acidilactici]MDB8865981.1 hypothetical protein [Pediococcus acidilactici]
MAKIKEDLGRSVEILKNKVDVLSTPVMANRQVSGQMSAEAFRKLKAAEGWREQLPDGTDIMKLKPGHYWGSKLVNSVVDANTATEQLIDVDWRADDSVQYRLTVTYTGETYYRVYHKANYGTNTNVPDGWSRAFKHYTLWQGDQSTVNSTMTLTDTVDKFLELRFTLETDASGEDIMYEKVAKTISLHAFNVYDDPKNPGFSIYEETVHPVGDKITIIGNRKLEVLSGSVTDSTTSDLLRIRKIEGVF